MPKGRPDKWATAIINEPVMLGKPGIHVTIWEKYGRRHKGTVIISVGGLRWRPYSAKKWLRVSWDDLASLAERA